MDATAIRITSGRDGGGDRRTVFDGGFDAAHDFIHRFILSDLENKILFYDSKTVLQEILQAEGDGEFSYELKGEEGPDRQQIVLG